MAGPPSSHASRSARYFGPIRWDRVWVFTYRGRSPDSVSRGNKQRKQIQAWVTGSLPQSAGKTNNPAPENPLQRKRFHSEQVRLPAEPPPSASRTGAITPPAPLTRVVPDEVPATAVTRTCHNRPSRPGIRHEHFSQRAPWCVEPLPPGQGLAAG